MATYILGNNKSIKKLFFFLLHFLNDSIVFTMCQLVGNIDLRLAKFASCNHVTALPSFSRPLTALGRPRDRTNTVLFPRCPLLLKSLKYDFLLNVSQTSTSQYLL